MRINPWLKLILVSIGALFISLALLWSVQQITIYKYTNGNQNPMNMPGMQQDMNMQMNNGSNMGHGH